MFSHIDLSGLQKSSVFSHAVGLPFFKDRPRLDFKPGLNIIVGPNGSGKSTVLRMLAESMCAFQGGVSKVTDQVVSDIGLKRKDKAIDPMGVKVVHDGQPVIFCDPRQIVGLVGGAFDYDFMDRGVQETMTSGKQSHGQNSMRRANQALAVLLENKPFPDASSIKLPEVREGGSERPEMKVLRERMAASIPMGQPTILFDEPEANYSLLWQARLWDILSNPERMEKFQIIVATHSAFALGIPHAHYIEVEPLFRLEAEALLRMRFSRPMLKPDATS